MDVLLVDDHPILHETLRVVVGSVAPQAQFHGETSLGGGISRARQLKDVPNDPARDAYVYDFKATLGDGSHVELPFGERETRGAAGIPGWVARECEAIWRARAGIAR